ncbi:MAG: hypothetical protein M5U01_35830 [Ardenticatenaceae bacterium]|nr:hypothetical protein [Ardenticatenaceae bacterium]
MPLDNEIPGSPADWLLYARRDLAMARVALPEGGAVELAERVVNWAATLVEGKP